MSLQVLLADSAALNRSFLANALREDYDVIPVATEVEVAACLHAQQPALVLAAPEFCEAENYALVRTLAQRTPPVPVVMVLNNTTTQQLEQAFAAGVVDVVHHPFYPAVLRQRVANTLRLCCVQAAQSPCDAVSAPTAGRANTPLLVEQERAKYEFFAELANETMLDYDGSTDTLTISGRGAEVFCVSGVIKDVVRHPEQLPCINQADLTELMRLLTHSSLEHPLVEMQLQLHMPNGSYRWFKISARSMWSADKEPRFTGYIARLSDVDDEVQQMETLKREAQQDALTQLYNHGAARRLVTRLLAQEPRQTAALLVFDLDDFKRANDMRGHAFGDEVLRHMAQKLRSSVRDGDIAARVGGDEFIVFLRDLREEEQIEQQVQRVFDTLTGRYRGFPLTVSLGAALYPQDGATYDTLFNSADSALYASKNGGKNRYAFYAEGMQGFSTTLPCAIASAQ